MKLFYNFQRHGLNKMNVIKYATDSVLNSIAKVVINLFYDNCLTLEQFNNLHNFYAFKALRIKEIREMLKACEITIESLNEIQSEDTIHSIYNDGVKNLLKNKNKTIEYLIKLKPTAHMLIQDHAVQNLMQEDKITFEQLRKIKSRNFVKTVNDPSCNKVIRELQIEMDELLDFNDYAHLAIQNSTLQILCERKIMNVNHIKMINSYKVIQLLEDEIIINSINNEPKNLDMIFTDYNKMDCLSNHFTELKDLLDCNYLNIDQLLAHSWGIITFIKKKKNQAFVLKYFEVAELEKLNYAFLRNILDNPVMQQFVEKDFISIGEYFSLTDAQIGVIHDCPTLLSEVNKDIIFAFLKHYNIRFNEFLNLPNEVINLIIHRAENHNVLFKYLSYEQLKKINETKLHALTNQSLQNMLDKEYIDIDILLNLEFHTIHMLLNSQFQKLINANKLSLSLLQLIRFEISIDSNNIDRIIASEIGFEEFVYQHNNNALPSDLNESSNYDNINTLNLSNMGPQITHMFAASASNHEHESGTGKTSTELELPRLAITN